MSRIRDDITRPTYEMTAMYIHHNAHVTTAMIASQEWSQRVKGLLTNNSHQYEHKLGPAETPDDAVSGQIEEFLSFQTPRSYLV